MQAQISCEAFASPLIASYGHDERGEAVLGQVAFLDGHCLQVSDQPLPDLEEAAILCAACSRTHPDVAAADSGRMVLCRCCGEPCQCDGCVEEVGVDV